jgi:class 3 adenylate cyclase
MICAACQHDNPSEAKFCSACGGRLALTCAACNRELPSDAKFCLQCGMAVGGPSIRPLAGTTRDDRKPSSASSEAYRGAPPKVPTAAPFQPHVQYVTTPDGVRIAYATFGSGGGVPLVFLRGHFLSHVEAEWRLFPPTVIEGLGRTRLVVRLDFRGSGLSDRDVADRSIAARVLDLESVVDRLGLDRLAIYAQGSAGLAAFTYAARHPERISHLILAEAWTRGSGDWDTPRIKALSALAETDWYLHSQAVGLQVGWTERGRKIAELIRESLSRDDWIALHRADWGVDLAPLLPQITAPTLVVSRLYLAHLVRPDLARQVVSVLRNAHLVSIRDDDEQTRAIENFLSDAPAPPVAPPIPPAAASAFRTILFTDLEAHTAMMQRLGDARGRDVLREHERLTREALRAHGGTEIKTMGDAFVVSFTSATKALECATALQQAFAQHAEAGGEPLRVRVGVNAGEPIAENDDLFGAAVIIASRLADEANSGQIVVADVVRQLVAGKDFLFSDRGETALKGIEAPIRTWELLW